MAQPFVKPRDAASVLIYRFRDGVPEVLVGRRRSRARFLPDMYVFPGGALDAADHRGSPINLGSVDVARMGVGNRMAHAQALVRAALREVREETGLAAQSPDLTYIGRAITPRQSPVRFHARFFAAPDTGFNAHLHCDGELQDLRWTALGNPEQLPLVDVTSFMLDELAAVLTGRALVPALLCYRDGMLRAVRNAHLQPALERPAANTSRNRSSGMG